MADAAGTSRLACLLNEQVIEGLEARPLTYRVRSDHDLRESLVAVLGLAGREGHRRALPV
jgi:hypothetical protein